MLTCALLAAQDELTHSLQHWQVFHRMDEMLRDDKFAAELEGYRGTPARTPDPPAGGAAASDSGASSADAAGADSGWWIDAHWCSCCHGGGA